MSGDKKLCLRDKSCVWGIKSCVWEMRCNVARKLCPPKTIFENESGSVCREIKKCVGDFPDTRFGSFLRAQKCYLFFVSGKFWNYPFVVRPPRLLLSICFSAWCLRPSADTAVRPCTAWAPSTVQHHPAQTPSILPQGFGISHQTRNKCVCSSTFYLRLDCDDARNNVSRAHAFCQLTLW